MQQVENILDLGKTRSPQNLMLLKKIFLTSESPMVADLAARTIASYQSGEAMQILKSVDPNQQRSRFLSALDALRDWENDGEVIAYAKQLIQPKSDSAIIIGALKMLDGREYSDSMSPIFRLTMNLPDLDTRITALKAFYLTQGAKSADIQALADSKKSEAEPSNYPKINIGRGLQSWMVRYYATRVGIAITACAAAAAILAH